MVSEEVRHGGITLFMCEFCGFGYKDLETAEDCEQHCGTRGFGSTEIRKEAVCVPKIQVIQTQ